MYTILLYYKYVPIDDPEKLRKDQFELCEKLGFKGRIIVSKEGINGTIEGLNERIATYLQHMRADERFADVDFKESAGTGKVFPRLSVKVRSEIVTLGTGMTGSDFKKGMYIEPEELQRWYDQGKKFVVVDMRNDYEHAIGHFENSVVMPAQNFRDIPKTVETLKNQIKPDEEVITVCTGGVRCEKASAYLMEQGFKNVHQLHGGIVRYLEKFPGKKFLGSLYVFDGRVALNYDKPEDHVVVGRCTVCKKPSENSLNCEYLNCHNHFVCCDSCRVDGVFCSEVCKQNSGH